PVSAAGTNPIYAALTSPTPAPLPPGVLFAGNIVTGFFRSQDTGNTWVPMDIPGDISGPLNPGAQAATNFSMAADPGNPNVVFVGGDAQPPFNLLTFPFTGVVNFTGRILR